jgi:hypothetical protein
MARANSAFLDAGDRFPDMALQVIDGSALNIPRDLADGFAVLLFYRFSA